MIYMLDADTLNYMVKGVSPANARMRELPATETKFALSQIAHFQVTRYFKLIGASKHLRVYLNLVAEWERIELTNDDWDAVADVWAERHRIGSPIQDADLMIAMTARKAGAVLVTNNTRHFEGLDVPLENWAL